MARCLGSRLMKCLLLSVLLSSSCLTDSQSEGLLKHSKFLLTTEQRRFKGTLQKVPQQTLSIRIGIRQITSRTCQLNNGHSHQLASKFSIRTCRPARQHLGHIENPLKLSNRQRLSIRKFPALSRISPVGHHLADNRKQVEIGGIIQRKRRHSVMLEQFVRRLLLVSEIYQIQNVCPEDLAQFCMVFLYGYESGEHLPQVLAKLA